MLSVKYFSLFRDNDLQNLEQSYDFTKTVTEHNLNTYDIMITFFLLQNEYSAQKMPG